MLPARRQNHSQVAMDLKRNLRRSWKSVTSRFASKNSKIIICIAGDGNANVATTIVSKLTPMQVLVSNCLGIAALCGNMLLDDVTFRHARYSDGTVRTQFTAQEALGNKDVILFYMSRESIDSRLARLEDDLATVRADLARTQEDLLRTQDDLTVNKGQTADVQQQLNRYEEVFILGQIAYFVDTIAAKRVYGDEYVETWHPTLGQILASNLSFEQYSNLQAFLRAWGHDWDQHELKRVTRLLRDERRPLAHPTAEARSKNKADLEDMIARRFPQPDHASSIKRLLDTIVDKFTHPAHPLIAR